MCSDYVVSQTAESGGREEAGGRQRGLENPEQGGRLRTIARLGEGAISQKKVKQRRREFKRKTQEVRAALAEQLRLLEKRCREFDDGDWGEAVDIATRLRVIFQEGSKTKNPSILQSLEARKVPMLSTVEPVEDSENVLALIGGLYQQRFAKDENGLRYELRPKLGDSLGGTFQVPAFRWWEGIVEIKGDELDDPGRHVYRRMDVAKGISEHDGGAHLAGQIPESHEILTRPGGLVTITMGFGDRAQEVPIVGVHLAMLRQIAYEALNSPALRALADPETADRAERGGEAGAREDLGPGSQSAPERAPQDRRGERGGIIEAVGNCAQCGKPIESTEDHRVLMEHGTKEAALYHTQCGVDETTRLIMEDGARWHVMLRAGAKPQS